MPRDFRDYYSIYALTQSSCNLEVFPSLSSEYDLEVVPQYKDNNFLEVFGSPSLNLPNFNPFPINEQDVQVRVIAGFVIIVVAAIVLIPYIGGASLVCI